MDAPQPPASAQEPSQDTEPGRERSQGPAGPAGPGPGLIGDADADWGDGDTLFDAQVEALRAAAQAAQAQGSGEAGGATVPSEEPTDNDATARIQRAAEGELEPAAAPAQREGKREERPTALLDMVPMPPQGQAAERRWAPGTEPTMGMSRQQTAAPDDERSLWPTLLTAAAAVLLGVLLGMGILRLHAGRGAPSMVLEKAQETVQGAAR